tara:strand:+ start:334 stop:1122 length:789 start_codon:yes stop_codon:yes gene_type:complete
MKISIWQTSPCLGIADSLQHLALALQDAANADSQLFISPEMFVGGYNVGAALVLENARRHEDIRQELCRLAAAHQIALVIGLATPRPYRPFNSCIAIDETGVERALHHKTHLFGDVDRAQFSPGPALSPVFEMCGWQIGLAICYDIEFPEVARDLALRGANLIVTPTANMDPFDSVATRLVPARAEENAVYLAYCNYYGDEGSFRYNGLSCVCGPDGDDLVRAGKAKNGVYHVTLSLNALQDARKRQFHLRDRRPDLYGKPE